MNPIEPLTLRRSKAMKELEKGALEDPGGKAGKELIKACRRGMVESFNEKRRPREEAVLELLKNRGRKVVS